jgi:hypothetical protein
MMALDPAKTTDKKKTVETVDKRLARISLKQQAWIAETTEGQKTRRGGGQEAKQEFEEGEPRRRTEDERREG